MHMWELCEVRGKNAINQKSFAANKQQCHAILKKMFAFVFQAIELRTHYTYKYLFRIIEFKLIRTVYTFHRMIFHATECRIKIK